MEQANREIRDNARKHGVFLWEVAQVYGCNDGNFSRKLRKELSDEEKAKINNIIQSIVDARK